MNRLNPIQLCFKTEIRKVFHGRVQSLSNYNENSSPKAKHINESFNREFQNHSALSHKPLYGVLLTNFGLEANRKTENERIMRATSTQSFTNSRQMISTTPFK